MKEDRHPGAAAAGIQRIENAAIAVAVIAAFLALGLPWWLPFVLFLAAFHVAVDRTLGYGLKLDAADHTHLGPIGRVRHKTGDRP